MAWNRRRAIGRVFVLACLPLCAHSGFGADPSGADGKAASVSDRFRVELIDGGTETVALESASNTQLSLRDGSRSHDMANVVGFERAESAVKEQRQSAEVWLANGDCLRVEPIVADDETLSARWKAYPQAELLVIPLERIAAIWPKPPSSVAARQKLYRAAAREPQKADVVWLASGDRVASEFSGATATQFLFQSGGKLAIDRDQLVGLRFNPELIAVEKSDLPRYHLLLSDGSRIAVRDFAWDAQGLSYTSVFGLKGRLPGDALFGCRAESGRIEPLSHRQPVAAKYTPYLGGTRRWVPDRNQWHGPLALRGRQYATGIGAYSGMELTYALTPQDRTFEAVVGIDDAANGGGDAVFAIDVDERNIWESPHLRGDSAAFGVPRIDLAGGKTLTLRVEFGEMGDVGDEADWCDAVIIQSPREEPRTK